MLGSTHRLEAQVNSGGGVELIFRIKRQQETWFSLFFFIFFLLKEVAENGVSYNCSSIGYSGV